MNTTSLNILLADDDADDCLFFKEALEELAIESSLTTVNNGMELMRYLAAKPALPDALFLDLNMPLKNGFECLTEIKKDNTLTPLRVFIYSTSFDTHVIDLLYEKGASNYIRKPGDFSKLKLVIHEAITKVVNKEEIKTTKDKFVIQAK